MSSAVSQRNKVGQRGVFMISALIMVIVFGAILTLWAEQESRRTRNARADAIGDALAVLGDHLDTYIKDNHKAIAGGTSAEWKGASQPPVTISNARRITADQIIRWMGVRGAGSQPPYMPQSRYEIRIDVDGCQAGRDREACKITGLVYIASPIVTKGRPDPSMAARAARRVGRHGGYAAADNPGVIRFNDGNGSVPNAVANPVGSNSAGILARRIGDVYSTQNEDYLPRDGSKPMRGNLRLLDGSRRFDITGVGDLDAKRVISHDVNSDNVSATLVTSNEISSRGKLTGNVVQSGSDIRASDVIRAGTDIHAEGHIRAGKGLLVGYQKNGSDSANWGSSGDLWVHNDGHFEGKVVMEPTRSAPRIGDACSGNPHLVASGSQILTCQNGRYSAIGGTALPVTSCERFEYRLRDTRGFYGRPEQFDPPCEFIPTEIEPSFRQYRFTNDVDEPTPSVLELGPYLFCMPDYFEELKTGFNLYRGPSMMWELHVTGNGRKNASVEISCYGALTKGGVKWTESYPRTKR